MKQWFGVRTFNGYEQKVIDGLKQQIKEQKMESYIDEIILPKSEEYTFVRNVLKKKEKLLYPGYIFVKMENTNELIFFVRGIQYVTGYAGISSMKEIPSPMEDSEIEHLKEEMQKIKVDLNVGDFVKVSGHELYDGQSLKIININPEKEELELELKSLLGDDERSEIFKFDQIVKK